MMINHRPGKENTNAVGLSQSPHLPEAKDDIDGLENEREQQDEFVYKAHKSDMEEETKTGLVHVKRLGTLPPQLPNVSSQCMENDLRNWDATLRRFCPIQPEPAFEVAGLEQDESQPDPTIAEILNRASVIQSQQEDEILREVSRWIDLDFDRKGDQIPSVQDLKGSAEELRSYRQILGKIDQEEDGLLVLDYICTKGYAKEIHRWILPKEDPRPIKAAFHWSHAHPTNGHFSQNTSVLRCQERFYWPGMALDIQRRVRQCADCLAKIKKKDLRNCQAQHAT